MSGHQPRKQLAAEFEQAVLPLGHRNQLVLPPVLEHRIEHLVSLLQILAVKLGSFGR
jgi:hypothetical protein